MKANGDIKLREDDNAKRHSEENGNDQ